MGRIIFKRSKTQRVTSMPSRRKFNTIPSIHLKARNNISDFYWVFKPLLRFITERTPFNRLKEKAIMRTIR